MSNPTPLQGSTTPSNTEDKVNELNSPLLSSQRSSTTTTQTYGAETKRFQQDDQIEILDYSEDAAATALYGTQINDADPSTTLVPKVPTLTQVIRYLHGIPGNLNVDEVYGQYLKIAKLSTSDSLNSYPKHVDAEYATLQTSPTTFTDPQTGVSVPVQSATYHQQLQSTLSTLGQPGIHGPGQVSRTLSSFEGIQGSTSLLQACANGAAAQGAAMKMGSISVTPDGTYLLDQALGDAIVDNLYTELSTSLGLEFVQYIQTTATLATTTLATTPTTTTTNSVNDDVKNNAPLSPTPNSHPGGVIGTSLPDPTGSSTSVQTSGTPADSDELLFNSLADTTQNNENPFLPSDSDDSNNGSISHLSGNSPGKNNSSPFSPASSGMMMNSSNTDNTTQDLLNADDDVQIITSQRIRGKTSKLVSRRQQEQKHVPPVVLSKKSLISPSTVYNAHNPEIDNLLQQQYHGQGGVGGRANPGSPYGGNNINMPTLDSEYNQPTFEPNPAPVGASITQTKDPESMIFIGNVDEPLSKTTFEQISFLSGFWPQATRFIVCGILGILMACITHFVQWIIGHLVTFVHWLLTVILQQQGGVIGYNVFTYALWPILAMVVVTIVVVIYWIPGVSMVYWAGIFAVKGSGLPALNAYFDGSYDQNVPLFGTKVLIAKLISVTLSLGGLLKGGLQGPLIHVGAMVARMTLKTTLKLLNTNLAHSISVFLCCCCFDRYGHARKLKFPWNKKKGQKVTNYIQSQHEKADGAPNPSTNGSNNDDYQPQQDTNDYYNDGDDEQWYDVEKELREQQLMRLSPPRLGDSTDVEKEMVNRINIYAHGVNIQHNNIVSFRENEENRLNAIKKQREQLQQSQYNALSSTLAKQQDNDLGSPTSPVLLNNTTPNTTPPQEQQPVFQYHNASRIATASQSPSAKGNDYNSLTSLTLSSRIELIVRSLSGPQDEHDALACGATAGFTCAFNAPLAGMVMIQSMIKQQFSFQLTLRMFFTALVSVLVSNLLTTGSNLPDRGFVDLDIPPIHPMPQSELYLCIVVGILGGLLGVFIIKFNVFLSQYRVKWYHDKYVPNIQLTILLAMLMIVPGILITVATPCTPITEESFPLCIDHPIRCMQLACPKGQFSQLGSLMFGTPDRLLRLAWDRSNDPANEFGALQLSFFFVVYCVLASASFLGAFPGGFFIPAILIGAMFGRLFARLVNYMFFPYYSLQLGVYATLGSVSMLASVNRVTLPIVAMMVEFTSDVQFLTPIMIIILFAKFIADFFCLGLEPEVGKLQPRITMALGEAASPVMGHVNAKDVLSVNSMIQGYPSFCLNDELYPGHSDLAVVGEIDSVHRLQALLETTTHSAFPVVSVLPSNITTCTHLQGLAQRVYQRSILKSLHLDQKSPNGLSMRTMSSLPNSASLVSSLSSLGNNWNASSLGSFLTPEMKAKQDQMAATLQSLQPYHDDLFAQCPCQNFQAGHGKFVGLITRRSLRTLIEKSVDYTRATRIINSGNHSRLFRGASSAELGGGDAASTLTNSSIPENQAADNTEQIKKETAEHQTWYQKLTSKFSKSGNITDTPGSVDSVTAQIDANKRSEQLDLVSEDGVTQKSSKKNRLGQFSQQVQHNSVKCQCLTCTTHRWALVRYHTPLLALFQHQNTKKRVFPLLANIYFQTGIYLKSIYKQSYQHLIQLSPQFQQQLQNSNVPNHLLSICHPVLVHRELLSTAINFISSLIKLPKLPQHLQDTIFRLAQMKSEKIDDNENDGLDESMTGPSLLAARKRQQQHNATLGNRGTVAAAAVAAAASTTTTTTTAPAPVPVAQLVRQTNNDDAFDTDMLFIPSFIRFVTWLEERSQIRYSLNKEHITKHKDNTNDVSLSLTNRTLNNDAHTNGISASTLCVSLVNTLPLSDTGVYVASHMTTGARLWRLFRTAGMAKIVIVNDAHEPVGIITRKDIVRADRYLTSQLNGFKTKLKK